MRMREVLTALVSEAEILHWDAINVAWRHQPGECETCQAAMAAQTVLSVNFIDFQRGDKVRIGNSMSRVFGVVNNVSAEVDVKLGHATESGIRSYADAPVGRYNPADLTRIE